MQTKQNTTALVWFRNNLRVADNRPLWEACARYSRVIGVYCLDPRHFAATSYGFRKTEKFRAKFLLETLSELQQNLQEKNISLLVLLAKPEDKIPQLIAQYAAEAIYFQKEWTSEEIAVNNALKSQLPDTIFWDYYDQFLFEPSQIPYKNFSQIPEIFTEFRKQVERLATVRPCLHIEPMPDTNLLESVAALPTLQDLGFEDFDMPPQTAFPFVGGENQASKRLKSYFWETKNLSRYKQTRNELVGADYSSKFSAWLANGSISARTIYWQIRQYEKEIAANEDTYWLFFELIWRDYFKYISLKHGNHIFKLSGILNKKYTWKNNARAFQQWINGHTPEPFVNANMIELKNTGFMSNRGRQNVASFWAKEWCQDWRMGAAYFEAMLIDYDVHSNYGNWLYCAGVGNDPRDRKFNIAHQAAQYDPDGRFQQIWLKLP
ncbi:deoxyribodipyrimidine photo-lyase [Flexibacter flexilis DSM 6793]|uniref:Cryptochrome DASH n=1 Tax=Flexibacter flexilis DSM 6793 TaxID=927664 RepID=A0A1I1NEZ1_9BACT|nr:DASH family cryptochrome [Flexibacter flexilis]SFC95832.1 deoxyribodipyrimidine photo-lyase [Flexibacter flexilis DSM 6793]